MTTDRDTALMMKVAAGNMAALEEIYHRHAAFIYRTAFRFVGNEEDARDITQSVFVTLMCIAHRYRPRGKLTTWLYRIVANRCYNHVSRAEHRLRAVVSDDGAPNHLMADAESMPDHQLDRRQKIRRVRSALCQLPERQRMAVILRRFEEKSYAEIAEIMECSVGSVESLLFRARKSLRTLLP